MHGTVGGSGQGLSVLPNSSYLVWPWLKDLSSKQVHSKQSWCLTAFIYPKDKGQLVNIMGTDLPEFKATLLHQNDLILTCSL